MKLKSFQLDIAFEVNPMVIISTSFLTLGVTLKATTSNLDDLGIIRQSSFYSINVPNLMQKDPQKVLFLEYFSKINKIQNGGKYRFFAL